MTRFIPPPCCDLEQFLSSYNSYLADRIANTHNFPKGHCENSSSKFLSLYFHFHLHLVTQQDLFTDILLLQVT